MVINLKRETMRTGIKILFKKIFEVYHHTKFFHGSISEQKFPENPIAKIKLWSRLRSLEFELRNSENIHNLGSLHNTVSPAVLKVYQKIIKYNPSNLGNWSDKQKNYSGTQVFETEVIDKMKDWFKLTPDKFRGYVTSGATEGNLFLMWCGREYLYVKTQTKKICLLKTSLTHYSVRKAGEICGLDQYVIPINDENWSVDIDGFEKKVVELTGLGYQGFIYPITIGYSSTGTIDDVKQLLMRVAIIRKNLPKVVIYLWIDAAYNGLFSTLVDNSLAQYNHQLIMGVVVDFHKFGLAPVGSGVVLYRENLKNYITKQIDYLAESDETISGSRSGVAAVAIWILIHVFGKQGYKKLADQQFANKQKLITRLNKLTTSFRLITHKSSLSCGLIYKHNSGRLPVWMENKYFLFPGKLNLMLVNNEGKIYESNQLVYKIFLLPRLKGKIVDEFVDDIQTINSSL